MTWNGSVTKRRAERDGNRYRMPPWTRIAREWSGWSKNQNRRHSSRMARWFSEVMISSSVRSTGSAEYIGMKHPVFVLIAIANSAATMIRFTLVFLLIRNYHVGAGAMK